MTEIREGESQNFFAKIHTYLTQEMTSRQIYWFVTLAGAFSLATGAYSLFDGVTKGQIIMSSPSTWLLLLSAFTASLAAFTSEINRLAQFSKTVTYFAIVGLALFLSLGSILVVALMAG
ncbi:hypothetical protein [Rhizobium leguminosarum]|uniref:Uncharacterized protein n=1 Tax=Rhizobium leguminosarum TaxID=384 RepID=A0A7M3DW92_RHILE|nr:hypothetical protein [Rhizobium leguminosarum]TAY52954.1 hypothetical protein ELH90_15620 [Rhizobium leguminosarum]